MSYIIIEESPVSKFLFSNTNFLSDEEEENEYKNMLFKEQYPEEGDEYRNYIKGVDDHDAKNLFNFIILPFIKFGALTNTEIKNFLIDNNICKDYIETDEELFENCDVDLFLLNDIRIIDILTDIIISIN